MNFEFFKVVMKDSIIDTFGAKNYSQSRVKEIWEAVSDLTDDEFKCIAKNLVGNRPVNTPPLLDDFKALARVQDSRRFKTPIKSSSESLPISMDGLKRNLDRIGATSLLDAVKKRKWARDEK